MMALRACTRIMVVIVIFGAAVTTTVAAFQQPTALTTAKMTEETMIAEESTHSDVEMHSIRGRETKSPEVTNRTEVTNSIGKLIHKFIEDHVKELVDEENQVDEATWADGLSLSSAGNGKERASPSRSNNRDVVEETKTLSQQVKEGKYALIQDEIYAKTPKRPGIISYLGNPEVPKDTRKNLGGLQEDEIWLAENHLLVLRGGKFPDHGSTQENDRGGSKWPPIDNYNAPERQVKIPKKPEVPPPFPVQLTEGGPFQIIGANGSVTIVNGTQEYDYPSYAEGFFPTEMPFFPPSTNLTAPLEPGYANKSSTTHGQEPKPNDEYHPPRGGSLGPFYLTPLVNLTDYDDDDQSIYYPPPYSFQYQQDNSTAVPPGPFVPGIILPPPPNFFGALEEKKSTTKQKQSKRPVTTPVPTTKSPIQTTSPRSRTKSYKYQSTATSPSTPTYSTTPRTTGRTHLPTTSKHFNKIAPIRPTSKTPSTRVTPIPIVTLRNTETTTPTRPVTTSRSNYLESQRQIENRGNDITSLVTDEWAESIDTTPIPLVAYYATTSRPSERIQTTPQQVDIPPIHIKASIAETDRASYYFYKETNDEKSITTTTPRPLDFETNTASPYYNMETVRIRRPPQKQYYSVEMTPSQQTDNDYNLRLSSLGKSAPTYRYSETDPFRGTTGYDEIEVPTLRNQRILMDPAQRYYQSVTANKQKTYDTTQRPRYYYQTAQTEQYDYRAEPESKTNPIYRYSYEADDYSKQRRRHRYRQELQEPVAYDYQETTDANRQYYDIETGTVGKVKKARVPFLDEHLSYQTTLHSAAKPTPNPLHAYYTKQDEHLVDDVTKQYFTLFGKKLTEKGIESTTSLYRIASTTEKNANDDADIRETYSPHRYTNVGQSVRFPSQGVRVHYGDQTQRTFSLKDDTLVNYRQPLPPINPDAEFISITEPNVSPAQPDYGTQRLTPVRHRPSTNYVPTGIPRESYRPRYTSPRISLENDIRVNYLNPRPTVDPEAEFIDPVRSQTEQTNGAGGSYFAYELPGNGGHFYFLTPQSISQRQDVNDGYLYPKPTGPRLMRRR